MWLDSWISLIDVGLDRLRAPAILALLRLPMPFAGHGCQVSSFAGRCRSSRPARSLCRANAANEREARYVAEAAKKESLRTGSVLIVD
jgi:hypothetical protein